MSNEVDELSDINKKHRQKILLLKNRTQNMFKRANPMKFITKQNIQSKQKQVSALQFLKQYESNQSSQPQNEYSSLVRDNKSFNFNSTLFKNIRQQSHIAEKQQQIVSNDSRVSQTSSNAHALQTNQIFRDNNLLNKIDLLLNGRKKQGEKQRIKNIYDQYLQKKSSSSHSTPNNSDLYGSSTSKFSKEYKNPHIEFGESKNISDKIVTQLQNNKIKNKKQKHQAVSEKEGINSQKKLPPKSPLKTVSTIQRQKKKLQQTMKVMKKQQQLSEGHEKSQLFLELSDESQIEESSTDIKQLKDKKIVKHEQIMAMKEQKAKLVDELKILEIQLEKLERQQQQQDQ